MTKDVVILFLEFFNLTTFQKNQKSCSDPDKMNHFIALSTMGLIFGTE